MDRHLKDMGDKNEKKDNYRDWWRQCDMDVRTDEGRVSLDEIEGGEIRLVDPDKTNVEAVAQMLHKFNEIRVKDYAISVVDDRKAALKDADFVLTTFSPGSMDAFYNDLEIPVKYGIRLPVSMTVGIPGISAAIRTVPVAYEIVKEMEEVCPGAWLLNVTNPMSCVTVQ